MGWAVVYGYNNCLSVVGRNQHKEAGKFYHREGEDTEKEEEIQAVLKLLLPSLCPLLLCGKTSPPLPTSEGVFCAGVGATRSQFHQHPSSLCALRSLFALFPTLFCADASFLRRAVF
jgi:hypothetical protein